MKKKNTLKIMASYLLSLVFVFALSSASIAAVAAAPSRSYYICYDSDDYRVRERNALTVKGEEYTISPYLNRGERFLISDGKGELWGDKNGQPITVTQSGNKRYTVRFDPEGFESGEFIMLTDYRPETFTLSEGDEEKGVMSYLSAQTAREEYYFYLDAKGGERVTVTGENGTVYGEDGAETDGVLITIPARYRIAFTADEDRLFVDGKYIKVEEYPDLYLLCKENDYKQDESYKLTRDEETVLYAQYKAEITVPEKDCELTYSVYDADSDETYKPSSSGTVTVKDKGRYEVLYSPDHIYSASGDDSFHVALSRKEEFYDGWYALGDFNGYTFIPGDEGFDSLYKFVKNEEQNSYDEYKLTLSVTESMLDEFDSRVEFYISDGKYIYRRPNGNDIGIEERGEYEITFSPTHDYGRGYRYRYVRVSDSPEKEEVLISSGAQLMQMLSLCTSPEYSLNKKFILTTDIDVSGVAFTPAFIFAGEFDGLYRKVSGIKSTDDHKNFLFREVTDSGVIRRVDFNVDITSGERNTALVGINNGLIEEVRLSGRVKGNRYAGGIAAVNEGGGVVRKCECSAYVGGVIGVGGIVGFNVGEVDNSVMKGSVNTETQTASDATNMLAVGGIVGYSTGNILACKNGASVGVKQGRYVGGIVGLSSGGIFTCENTGEVSGASYVGGIVGYYGRLQAAPNDPSGGAGGIGGALGGGVGSIIEGFFDDYFGSDDEGFKESVDSGVHEIFYCVSRGGVYSSGSYAGGIAAHAGAASLNITAAVSTAKIEARYSHAGGIVGELTDGKIFSSLASGEVTASTFAGGIAGESSARIDSCLSTAYVKADSHAGGIAGSASGRVLGCISTTFIERIEDEPYLGIVAGEANVNLLMYNYYLDDGREIGGVNGVSYGYENDCKACALKDSELKSEGMLSDRLYGLEADNWLAGENEKAYPVPRALTEVQEPDIYADKAKFLSSYETMKEELEECSVLAGKTVVTVTFYTYDFDSENYERAAMYRIPTGTGLNKDMIPAPSEKEGYFVWWETGSFDRFDASAQIFQKFDRVRTTVASDDSVTPLVLAEGKFHSGTELVLEYNGEYISLKFMRGGEAVSYGDTVVRYRVDRPDRAKIELVRGGEIIDAQATLDGKYYVFTLPEGWSFAAADTSMSLTPLWITLAAFISAVVVALAFIIPLVVLHFRRKKRAGV